MENLSNKNIDTSLYNEKSLHLLNIRELRDIGRKFGVPSPTTMKKQDLIDYILKIVYGEVVAPTRSNYGRPSVREFNVNQYLDKIKKNSDLTDELLKLKLYDENDLSDLKVAAPSLDRPTFNIETRVYFEENDKAYLRVYQFVESEKDIEINISYARELGLENFDVLELIVENNLFKIVTINGINQKNKFDDLVISNEQIISGKNKVFYLRTEEERENIIAETAEKCEKLGIKLIIFSQKKCNVSCTNNIIYDAEEDYSKMYKSFMSVLGECEKLAFASQDFILVLEDANEIDEMLNSFDVDVSERIQKNVNEMTNRFLKLGNLILTFRIQKEVVF